MAKDFEKPLITIVRSAIPGMLAIETCFQDMCFVQVQIQKPGLKEANFGKGTWVIIIGVTGEMKGQVLLAMSEEDACNIASKMCMMEVKEIDDFAASALSELGNMIMGNASTVFSDRKSTRLNSSH